MKHIGSLARAIVILIGHLEPIIRGARGCPELFQLKCFQPLDVLLAPRETIMSDDAIRPNKPVTYRDAGVDIDAGDALVNAIKPFVKATQRAGADSDIGGFGGLFDLKAAGFKDPILVAANDGVGTKLKIAIETGQHGTIGIDLVAMCVNDLVVQGAEPLFFLDYFSCGKLEARNGGNRSLIKGIADGLQAGRLCTDRRRDCRNAGNVSARETMILQASPSAPPSGVSCYRAIDDREPVIY